jgi:16S rRNA (cytidine1402-2'-O)-methyltransferase
VTRGAPPVSGTLYVVSTPIGNLADLSERARDVLRAADILACEDTRRTGRLLELVGVEAPRLVALHLHNETARADGLVDRLRDGATVALVSDAGTPLVSDPGAHLVARAVQKGIPVVAVPGASAILAALVVSGFDTHRWRFEGFLPRKGGERRSRLADIAGASHPSVVFESPHRLQATLEDLAEACGAERNVVVARELTKLHEQVLRSTLAEAAVRAATGGDARGEHVLVVDGAPPARGAQAEPPVDALRRLVGAGLSKRDAVTAVVLLLGVSRQQAYSASLELDRT